MRALRCILLLWLCACDDVSCLKPYIPDPCNGEEIVTRQAGDDAFDCGRAFVGEDAGAIHDCTIGQLDAGTAFKARFDLGGADTRKYVTRDGTGSVQIYGYEGEPPGPGGRGATLTRVACLGPHPTKPPHEPRQIGCTAFGETDVLCADKQEPRD